MTGNISKTLLERLFDLPNPNSKLLYTALFSTMFPEPDDFKHFLQSQRHDDQIRYGKRILLRISATASLPGSNRLLLNLLAFEAHSGGRNVRGHYVGRDHFVHLVHLYLFGLYVFWYHRGFFSLIVKHFSTYLPSTLDTSDFPKQEEHAIRLFLDTWKNFVIFHDLSYPFEASKKTDDDFTFIKPLGRGNKNLEKELSLLCFSRVITFHMLMETIKPFTTFRECYSERINELEDLSKLRPIQFDMFRSRSPELKVGKWYNAQRMPHGLGVSILPFLESSFGPENILIAIERSSDRYPLCLFEITSQAILISQIGRHFIGETQLQTLLDAIKRRKCDFTEPENIEIVAYVNSFDLEELWRKCCGENQVDYKTITLIAKSYFQTVPIPYSVVSPRHTFENCVFHIYQAVLRDLDYATDDDDVTPAYSMLSARFIASKTGVRNLESRLLSELNSYLAKKLKTRSKHLNDEGVRLSTQTLEVYIKDLLSPVSNIKQFRKEFFKVMSRALNDHIEVHSQIKEAYESVRERIRMDAGIERDEWGDNELDYMTMFKKGLDLRRGNLINDVANRFKAASGAQWREITNYRPEYIDKADSHVDHGIFGACLAASLGDKLCNIHAIQNKSVALKVATVSMWQRPVIDSNTLKCIYQESIYTILIHNLYPDFFVSDTASHFRTSWEDNPFAFFSLFCDSLQPWDRKKLTNPAHAEMSQSTISQTFDVDIQRDILFISERGDELRIDDRINVLRRYLDCYLKSASSLIKLRLEER